MALFESIKVSKRQEIEAVSIIDFTGGLHIGVSPAIIESNEVSAALNVDFHQTGGVERRRALWPLTATDDWGGTPGQGMFEYRRAADIQLYFNRTSDDRYYQATMTPRAVWGSTTGDYQGISLEENITGWLLPEETLATFQVGQYIYLYNGTQWHQGDGTSNPTTAIATTLRTDAEDFEGTGLPDFDSFSKLGIPAGQVAVVWDSRVWVGNTPVSGPASLYFSFSFGVEEDEGPFDFYENWFYQFDPASDSDEIVALAPVGSTMYVFMHQQVHVLTPFFGEPANLFYELNEFSSRIGLVGKHAVTTDSGSVWFFDVNKGLMQITPDGQLVGHSEKVDEAFKALGSAKSGIVVEMVRGRVWVSIPDPETTAIDTLNRHTYVYDPALQAWTYYDIGFQNIYNYRPHDTDPEFEEFSVGLVTAAAGHPVPALVALDYAEKYHETDYYGRPALSPGSEHEERAEVSSSFTTAWFDVDVPEAVKEWLALDLIFRSNYGQSMLLEMDGDWDGFNLLMSSIFDTANPRMGQYSSGVQPGAVVSYPAYERDVNNHTPRVREYYRDEVPEIQTYSPEFVPALALPVRVNSHCFARTVSLTFESQNSIRWALDRFTLYFARKQIRV